jgi:anti-repressor protein
MNELVFIENGQVVTDSLVVSGVFGKEHKNVMRDIDTQLNKLALAGEGKFNKLNFERIEYKDARNRTQEKYNMTEDAFTLVAMSYTTPEAMKFKVKFIEAFKKMREELSSPKALSEREQRVELLKLTLEHEEKFEEYDGRLSKLEDNVRIDSFQQNVIQKQVKKRVYKVFEDHNPNGLELSKLFPCIHRNLRDSFGVPTYKDLRKLDFDDALSWVKSWRPLI